MANIVWDKASEHYYETGVDHGVLYVQKEDGSYDKPIPWNGLTGITESPSGAEATDLYADNIKYLSLLSAETFSATVEAYTYPDEFAVLDGSAELTTGITVGQQARGAFGLCYRTKRGNDVKGDDYGYRLHLIYGCKASPSEKAYTTISDSPDAITFSWEINSTPVNVEGFKPTCCVVVDSVAVGAANMKKLEDALYDESTGKLLLPDDIKKLLATG